MHYKNERAFVEDMRGGVLYSAYLFYGPETYLVEKYAKKIFGKGDDPFNSQRFDGGSPDIPAIYDAAEALPVFADKKQVLVDNLDPAKLSPEDLDGFEALLENLPETTTLIVTLRGKEPAPSAAAKKIIKLMDKYGAAVELGARAPGELAKFCRDLAKKLGCELSAEGAKYLLRICHNDMQPLENETRKICAYLKEGEITRDIIDILVTPKIEARVFDLQKYIIGGEAKKALELLSGLFALKEEPVGILAVLSMSFCDMYRARAARDAGVNSSRMLKDFEYKSAYRAENAFRAAGGISVRQARAAVNLLCEGDRKMKSLPVDNKIILEQTVLELMILCGRPA
jgi:DNA polymerase-3 subunit delta